MRTRIDDLVDKKTLELVHGVSVRLKGRWYRLAENGKLFAGTRDAAEALRAKVRTAKRPES